MPLASASRDQTSASPPRRQQRVLGLPSTRRVRPRRPGRRHAHRVPAARGHAHRLGEQLRRSPRGQPLADGRRLRERRERLAGRARRARDHGRRADRHRLATTPPARKHSSRWRRRRSPIRSSPRSSRSRPSTCPAPGTWSPTRTACSPTPAWSGIKTGSLDACNLLSAKDIDVGDTTVRMLRVGAGPARRCRSRLEASRALYSQLEAELQPRPSVDERHDGRERRDRWGESVDIVTRTTPRSDPVERRRRNRHDDLLARRRRDEGRRRRLALGGGPLDSTSTSFASPATSSRRPPGGGSPTRSSCSASTATRRARAGGSSAPGSGC